MGFSQKAVVRLRSPIWYFGGKGLMVSKLLKLVPPHHIYVEVFGGGASLLFAKSPSPVEVYNDIDQDLVNFFRVLRDPAKFEKFYKKVALTPYSRAEYYFCRDTWKDCEDEIERAYRWYIVARWSFGGDFENSWGFVTRGSSRNMAKSCSSWLSIIEMLPEIHSRIMRVQIECQDFRKIFKTYDTPETFFYCDPPYLPDTRKKGGYSHEMASEDHKELVQILLEIKGKALLSGYRNEVYTPLEEAGWRRIDFPTACFAAGRTRGTGILGKGSAMEKQPRIESVWVSPNVQEENSLFKWD